MKKIALFTRKENCCGCTACKYICPVNAIEMQSDSEGFTYPAINNSLCVCCGKCLQVCKFNREQLSYIR